MTSNMAIARKMEQTLWRHHKKLKTKNQVKTNQLKEYGRTIIGWDAKTKSTAVLKTLRSGDGKILHQCHSHPLLPVCAAGWNLYAPGSLDRHGASALEAQLHSDHSVSSLSTFKCLPQKTKLSPPRASRINQSQISVGLGFWKWPHSLRRIAAGSFSLPTKGGWRHVLHCASICSYLRRWMATFTRYIREDMGRVCGNWVCRWEISVH